MKDGIALGVDDTNNVEELLAWFSVHMARRYDFGASSFPNYRGPAEG